MSVRPRSSRRAPVVVVLLAVTCGSGERSVQGGPTAGGPRGVETEPPNAPSQHPAFPGQTRAPERKAGVAFRTETFVPGLEHPWGLAFLPDGRLLVSERPGRLRLVSRGGEASAPIPGLPAVDARGQGGLLGLAVDPDFAGNGRIYACYAEREGKLTHTAVARGTLAADGTRVDDVAVIFRQTPSMDSTLHYGCRLVWDRGGNLFVTLGERSILPGRRQAERLDGTLGKVVRIRPDGSIPADNPFVGRPDARPEIWSIGHRNIQAAALHPVTGRLWTVEHGARGGDEIDVVEAGKDYGWPTITYGIEYSGAPIGQGITQAPGLEQPIYYWDPVIAPSGAAFYEADLFPAWKGSLFVGSLKQRHLARLTLDGERVVGEERLLTEGGERIRDVVVGPEGALYVATDEARGRVLRIVPPG